MNEQTSQSSKSIFCDCRSAPVFQASHSRKRPLTGYEPYRHCEQNPKNSRTLSFFSSFRYICNRKKTPRRWNKFVSKSGFKPGARSTGRAPPPPCLIIFFSICRQLFEEENCSAPSCLENSRAAPVISFLICWLINYNVFFIHVRESWFSTVVWLECHYEVTHCREVWFYLVLP
jgi:hypothetical protein